MQIKRWNIVVMKLKISFFIILALSLLYWDYVVHEELSKELFKNYSWLSYFRFNTKFDLIYSVDVIVGTSLFVAILLHSLISKKFNSWIYVAFTVISILLHFLSLNGFLIF